MIDCMINLPTSTVYVMCMCKYCGAGGWSVNGNCNEIKIKDNDRRHRPLSDPIHDYILHGLERHIINIWKTKRHRFMWFNCWPPWSTEECRKHCFFSEMEKKNGITKQKCYRRNLLPSLFIYEQPLYEDFFFLYKKLVFIEFLKFLIFESIQFQCNSIEWKWFLVLDSNHLFKANKRIARITLKWMAHS